MKNIEQLKNKLNELEYDNQHTLYLKELALYCNETKLAQQFELIEQLHILEGSMNYYLSIYRQYLSNVLKMRNKETMDKLGLYTPSNIKEFIDN